MIHDRLGEVLEWYASGAQMVPAERREEDRFIVELERHVDKEARVFKKGLGYDDCCCICLDEFENADVVLILSCNHQYHVNCIKAWHVNACPQCKGPIVMDGVGIRLNIGLNTMILQSYV